MQDFSRMSERHMTYSDLQPGRSGRS